MRTQGRDQALKVADDGMQYRGRQLLFGFLHLALVTPSIYLILGMPLVLRQYGWSGTQIGLFQLAGLPAVFKFVLAVPVERMRWGAGHYKIWTIVLSIAYVGLLLAMGRQNLVSDRGQLFLIALGAALMATWADIPVNALAIKVLPPSERLRAGGVRSASIFFGAIIGGGLMLLVHERWGWQAPFIVMMIPILIGIGLLAVFREPASAHFEQSTRGIVGHRDLVIGYFKQPGAYSWTVLLLSYFPLVGAGWVYLKPLLLDHGFAPSHVAWLAGVLGSTVGALASIGTAKLVRVIGVANSLALFAGMNVIVLGMLALLAWAEAGQMAFSFGTMVLACSMGATSALAFGLMMGFTRPQYQAVDYGTQASLFTLSRLLILPFAGAMLDRFGYSGMLSILTLAMLGVLALAMRQRRRIDQALTENDCKTFFKRELNDF